MHNQSMPPVPVTTYGLVTASGQILEWDLDAASLHEWLRRHPQFTEVQRVPTALPTLTAVVVAAVLSPQSEPNQEDRP